MMTLPLASVEFCPPATESVSMDGANMGACTKVFTQLPHRPIGVALFPLMNQNSFPMNELSAQNQTHHLTGWFCVFMDEKLSFHP